MIFSPTHPRASSTNLPKEIMEFRDCPMPSSPRSYIASDEFLSYLHLYADRFDLVALIKFNYYVIRVRPIEDTKWEVIKSKQMNLILIDAAAPTFFCCCCCSTLSNIHFRFRCNRFCEGNREKFTGKVIGNSFVRCDYCVQRTLLGAKYTEI